MRFWRWLEKYPDEAIADTVGVSEKTVSKWRRSNSVPERHRTALLTVKSKRIASPARRRKVLFTTDIFTLASLSGGTVKQVKQWRKKKDIPLKYRMFLVDSFSEVIFILGPPTVWTKTTRNFIFTEHYWNVSVILTDGVLVEILRAISAIPIEKIRMQTRLTGKALLSVDDPLLKYPLVELRITKQGANVVVKWYTALYSNIPALVEATKYKLLEQLDKDMTMMQISVMTRKRINVD